jgi:acyl-CoA synthetase (AMP-forming)/AMP-acid ligase II
VAAILYTSGSTGRPKGVVLSPPQPASSAAESVGSYLGNTADDVILSAAAAQLRRRLQPAHHRRSHVGAHVVLVNYLLAATWCRCAPARRHRADLRAAAVDPAVDADWPPRRPRSCATSPTPAAGCRGDPRPAARDLPGRAPYLMYGLTEAFRSTYLDPAEVDGGPTRSARPSRTPRSWWCADGRPCEPGEPGELVHRGALVALGYWNDPERTAERFRPLPAATGAAARSWRSGRATREPRREGFLYFVGRRDDMIKTSGYRVSPTEIEEVVYDTGLVRDAVALGRPDDRLGQRIVLVVTPADGRELDPGRRWRPARRNCPLTWCPTRRATAPELPRSPNGKFDRHACCAELQHDRRERGPPCTRIAAFDPARRRLTVGGVPLDRLAERRRTPFFAYDRAMLTDRVERCARAAPRRS